MDKKPQITTDRGNEKNERSEVGKEAVVPVLIGAGPPLNQQATLALKASLGINQSSSLYVRVGKQYTLAALSSDLIDRLIKNEVLNSNPSILQTNKNDKLIPGRKYLLCEYLCEATGGPQKYSGGISISASHSHLNISEAEWDAFMQEVSESLNKLLLEEKEKDEMISLLSARKSDIVTLR